MASLEARSPGLLAAWLKVPASADEEFNDWYNTEHLAQISGNSGFKNGRRYRSLESEWYLALYDLESADACLHPSFQGVIANPTPWSRRIAKLYGRNRIRSIYRNILDIGSAPAPAHPAPFIFTAQMDVPAAIEPEFNDWYDNEHATALADVPDCLRVRRFVAVEGAPRYLAVYDLRSPEVLNSKEWLHARELGRTAIMRTHMSNVTKSSYRLIYATDATGVAR
jgi:hypothetical protein